MNCHDVRSAAEGCWATGPGDCSGRGARTSAAPGTDTDLTGSLRVCSSSRGGEHCANDNTINDPVDLSWAPVDHIGYYQRRN
jgi:hypothetical protein